MNLKSFLMPYTDHKAFQKNPKLFSSAKGMYYYTDDGRKLLDGTAGLWCVNAGHQRSKIIHAVQEQVAKMAYCPTFHLGHVPAFELAERITKLAPEPLNHLFFSNSGSEAVDSALKIALAYQKLRNKGGKTRIISREKGYHGSNFGGTSVGGIGANRKHFTSLLSEVNHLPHTYSADNCFTKGLPPENDNLADQLENIIAFHDVSTIAAVIVEPISGSAGVILPPKGYLQRLRDICTKHDILLIFDEVITAFGRIGDAFASTHWGITPDLITIAKSINSGVVPMGGVIVSDKIYDTLTQSNEPGIDFFHGYTCSGHPLAVAAAMATFDICEEEKLFDKAKNLSAYWQEAVHSLRGLPYVSDIRNYGLMAAIDFEPVADIPTKRAFDVFNKAFFDCGLLVRPAGVGISLSPPLIVENQHIDELIGKLTIAIKSLD